ncbi:histidine-rich protein PFHRP-II-like [Aedes aegypti]|uniref:Uncharacterized protein n=1 Tax=Aedes aegypti TaxID=7159 RepID=A0A6I8U8Q5_AEDAE|nr:histidine-rich protein PFHRP-II-like [Aedes aegypti]XP_021712115.1 histidine-rich protein PFHRP-II-like [Aedes aegypti]
MKAFVLGSVLLLAAVCSGSYVPADTPEVAAAKAAHFAAHAHVAAHAAPAGPHWDHHDAPAQKWHGPIHIPQIHNGVPVETPEVQHAKAFHAAAYAKVSAYPHHAPAPHHAPVAHAPAHHGAGAWHGPQHVPVIHNGVPVETPEVQHAKAAHLNALASAGAHSHGPAPWAAHGHGHEDDGSYKPHLYEAPHY